MTGLLLPQYQAKIWNIVSPATLGELAIMLWLLIMGAKERQPLPAAAA